MGQGRAYLKVGPAIAETVSSFTRGDKDSVLIDLIYFSQRLYQIRRITFVTAKPGPN